MTFEEFEMLVAVALDDLPEYFAKKLDNVEVTVEMGPPGNRLFGLYTGIPQTQRGTYQGVLPDRIVIFMGTMLAVYGDDQDAIKKQVTNTVLHEIGHHFGMTDAEIRAAGK